MPRTLSPAAASAILASETDEVILACMTLVVGATTYRLVNNTEAITRAAGVYLPYSFDVVPPQDAEQTQSTLPLRVDNVDREVTRLIREFDGVPTCTIDWVLASDPNNIVQGPYGFSVVSCEFDEMVISVSLGYEEDFLNQAFPAQSYNPINSPGMYV